MSTKKDLTELLAYTVKKAEATTEVKVAWAGLSALEKVLVKQAAAKGQPIQLGSIKKLAALIEKRSWGPGCSMGKSKKKMKKKAEGASLTSGAASGLKMKKPKLTKSASYRRMYGMLKKAAANPRFGQLLKRAVDEQFYSGVPMGDRRPAIPPIHPNTVAAMSAAAPAAESIWNLKTAPEFTSALWKMTPGWGRALAVLGGAGLGAAGLWAGGKELKHRMDPGADRRLRGMGLPDDVVDALSEFAAKDTARYSQLAGIQDMFERSRPGRMPLYRAG